MAHSGECRVPRFAGSDFFRMLHSASMSVTLRFAINATSIHIPRAFFIRTLFLSASSALSAVIALFRVNVCPNRVLPVIVGRDTQAESHFRTSDSLGTLPATFTSPSTTNAGVMNTPY